MIIHTPPAGEGENARRRRLARAYIATLTQREYDSLTEQWVESPSLDFYAYVYALIEEAANADP